MKTKQEVLDREFLYDQRYDESQGGQFARSVGIIAGLTASAHMYARAQKHGFTGFFPLTRLNAGHYTWILGAGFLTYTFASGMVSSITGDALQ